MKNRGFFIVENFLFYSRLLRNYLERAKTFDIFAATRPADLNNNPLSANQSQARPTIYQSQQQPESSILLGGSSKSKALYTTIEKVLTFYKQSRGLLDVLRFIDAIVVGCALPDPVGISDGMGITTPTRPTSPRRSRSSSSGGNSVNSGNGQISSGVTSTGMSVDWVDRLGGVESVGSWTRNRIVDLETRIDYQSIFMGDRADFLKEAPGINLARIMLGNIYSTINRLNTYLPVADSHPGRPKTADKDWLRKRADLLQGAVSKLYSLSKLFVDIFGVKEVERAQIEAGAVGGGGSEDFLGNRFDEEDDENAFHSEILPGVLTPDVFRNDEMMRLTAAGRRQIKLGLRKSDVKNIPVKKNARVENLVMSYEFEWMFRFTKKIAISFDTFYDKLCQKYKWLPRGIGLHFLRWFASKNNLVTFLLGALFVIVAVFFWNIGGGKVPVTAAKAAGAASAAARSYQHKQQYSKQQYSRQQFARKQQQNQYKGYA
ncbi:hypothetical protein HK100_011294 [Physocladia obscura]|uniref:Uncharacterized protein n=1 Tax=Physocladia obscura TaxID=109957 RepID=A0AAD5T221_9FUNG|nr:hypothetical protein HK100_011294 [Physocladia obscura]